MLVRSRFRRFSFPIFFFPTTNKSKLVFSVLTLALASSLCRAQEPPPAGAAQANAPAAQSVIKIPAGTNIALVLTQPVRSKSMHKGDAIYAEVTAPVTVGDAVAIPPGAFLQGKVDKLARNGGRGELRLQSMTLTLPDGEVVPIAGPLNLESADGYAVPDATSGRSAAVFLLPLAGAGLGALIGHSAAGQPTTVNGLTVNPNRLRDTGIGTLVGAGLGAIASFAMIGTSRSFFLDTGTPADLVLPQPLSVGPGQVAAGMPSKSPPVQVVAPPPSANPNIAGCSARQESCHGSCVDTITFMNDSNNCGRCGNICSVGETCTGGSCSCGPGYSSCMGSCISDAALMSDNNNCGRCGNSCSIGQTCMGGTCTRTTPCAPGDLSCR